MKHTLPTTLFVSLTLLLAASPSALAAHGHAQESLLPTGELVYGMFTARFTDDAFEMRGGDMPSMSHRLLLEGNEISLLLPAAPNEGCGEPGRYAFRVDDGVVHLRAIADPCGLRRVLLDGSAWRPAGTEPDVPERRIELTAGPHLPALPAPADANGSWPSFRGPNASGVADGAGLPDTWDGDSGENVRWRVDVPGLAHSSPVVWGDRIFLTSAISGEETATFRPGLNGDGDASTDRSAHRFVLYAFDKHSGERLWERVAYEGTPVDRRHIKSTYASSTPATDGRVVIAYFGSQGLYGYDVNGNFRWKLDVGRVNVGAYNAPGVEWGPASSPHLWEGRVYLQVDTQQDSFLLCADAATGEVLWKAERDELPSWGTPTVVRGRGEPELVTNGSNYIRGYDPETGAELWRLGGSSKITAPTPVFTPEHIVVASGRHPERPIFVLRHGARGDITLPGDQTSSEDVVWSRVRRGPYMPTPLIYDGLLYVVANNGVFDVYDLRTGEEVYRTRVPHLGSGLSASPVAADGKIYLSTEDGDLFVVRAGREFVFVRKNSMGELLMATPAISDGTMYVRTVNSLFAIAADDSSPPSGASPRDDGASLPPPGRPER